jgi:hypothetical protein
MPWQDIKQAALSSGYDMAGLSHVLADPLLSETQAKVAQFQKEGWFMKYRLHRLKVRKMPAPNCLPWVGLTMRANITSQDNVHTY